MADNKPADPAKDGLQQEEKLEEMLDRLNQLRHLRSALQRMLAPLTTKQPSPQAAFAAYMQSVDRANKEVASFREALVGLHSDGVFAQAGASQKANPKGIKAWRARDDPDWADPDPKVKRSRIS
ncbi:6d3ccb14-ee1a-42d0-928e-d950a3592cf4 [Thermothielavioides terrestris]|uniref:6d3ccb14-ee1a-42d0-928e-d950a3592cf4 n=1 Tax=Thermothielavioides terrestris TaxID=2587410 RepID=A0A446BU83_9PEZI|nr:6d3ccb14-ee1a-42d0-928e-d950a3592cf4 [Thermothielavioides terrestris]